MFCHSGNGLGAGNPAEIERVKGEASDAAHPEWIDVGAFRWGVTGPGPTNGARFSGPHLRKCVDKASPALYQACASGKHFPKATLDLVRPGARRVGCYRITHKDVVVVSGGASAGASRRDLPNG